MNDESTEIGPNVPGTKYAPPNIEYPPCPPIGTILRPVNRPDRATVLVVVYEGDLARVGQAGSITWKDALDTYGKLIVVAR